MAGALTVHSAAEVLLDGDAILADQCVLLCWNASTKPQHKAVEQQQRQQLAEEPHQHGGAVLHKVHQSHAVPDLPLLLWSASGQTGKDKRAGRQAGRQAEGLAADEMMVLVLNTGSVWARVMPWAVHGCCTTAVPTIKHAYNSKGLLRCITTSTSMAPAPNKQTAEPSEVDCRL